MKTRFVPFAIFVLLFGCNQNSNTKNLAMSSDSEVTVTSQEATQFTIDRNSALRDYLDFSDTTDFRNTEKGFLGTVETGVIEQANGQLSYSMKQFDF